MRDRISGVRSDKDTIRSVDCHSLDVGTLVGEPGHPHSVGEHDLTVPGHGQEEEEWEGGDQAVEPHIVTRAPT